MQPPALYPPANLARFCDPRDGYKIGRQSVVRVRFLGHLVYRRKCVRHLPIELGMHVYERPIIVVRVLDLLEVGNRNATGVGQQIRDHIGALFKQNLVRFGSGRTVGQFANDLGFNLARVSLGDSAFQCGGIQYVALKFQ